MKLGNLEVNKKVFLAPMAGVTDLAFRLICKEMGAGVVFSEMISAKALYYKDGRTERMLRVDEGERPIAIQLFGSDPKIISYAIDKHINPRQDIDLIDINMGCPAQKIVKNGEGSALMKKPDLVRQILRAAVNASDKPVTLKIRMGWDKDSINAIDIGRIAEEEGIRGLTIHARTREMHYSGEADWDFIKSFKENIAIPVIGNGDIFTAEDGLEMLDYTKCDAIAIGRGAQGNPWIFKAINSLLRGEEYKPPSKEEVINLAIRHLDMVCDIKGVEVGVKEMRKHLSWYLKGMRGANEIKNLINRKEDKGEVKEILFKYLETNEED